MYYCTVNTKRKALDFYEDSTVNCILDAIFYFSFRDCASKKYIYIYQPGELYNCVLNVGNLCYLLTVTSLINVVHWFLLV